MMMTPPHIKLFSATKAEEERKGNVKVENDCIQEARRRSVG